MNYPEKDFLKNWRQIRCGEWMPLNQYYSNCIVNINGAKSWDLGLRGGYRKSSFTLFKYCVRKD